jgi:hypothetical protein
MLPFGARTRPSLSSTNRRDMYLFGAPVLTVWFWQEQKRGLNGTLRSECLDAHWFASLADAKQIIEAWRREYNESRPHRAHGERTPHEIDVHLRPRQSEDLNHNPEFEGTKNVANKNSYTAVVAGSDGRILANNGVSAYRQTMGSRPECIC